LTSGLALPVLLENIVHTKNPQSNRDEFNLYNINCSTSTCLHDKDEVQDQSVHRLYEMPLLLPSAQDLQNLSQPKQQFRSTPCIAGGIKKERVNRRSLLAILFNSRN